MQALFFQATERKLIFANALGMAAIGAGLVPDWDRQNWHLYSEDSIIPKLKRRYDMNSADWQALNKLHKVPLRKVVRMLMDNIIVEET